MQDATRLKIIEAAEALFADKGFTNTRTCQNPQKEESQKAIMSNGLTLVSQDMEMPKQAHRSLMLDHLRRVS